MLDKITAKHRYALGLLALWTFVLNAYGLGRIQFVRHTEADRTMIAQEMLESGNLLVPTLLHSEILTKPPGFYWLSALTQSLLGSNNESVARLPSVFAGIALVLLTYWFWYEITRSRKTAFLSGFVLSTTVLFYILSAVAEIDMLFALFSVSAGYSCFFVYERRTFFWMLFAAFFLGGAFITKGPPAYFFCGAGVFVFMLCDYFVYKRSVSSIFSSAVWTMSAAVLSLGFIALWLVPLINEVGWDVLVQRFNHEVLARVTSFSERRRGPFYYIGAILKNALPWTIPLVVGVYHGIAKPIFTESLDRRWYGYAGGFFKDPGVRRFIAFMICYIFAGFMMLSIAQGKSNRYCFPLIPFVSALGFLFSPVLLKPRIFFYVFWSFRLVSLVGIVLLVLLLTVGNLTQPTFVDYLVASVAVVIAAVVGLRISKKQLWQYSLGIIALLYFSSRLVQVHIYGPQRNESRSVVPISYQVNELVQPSRLYTLEMFERWIVYYARVFGLKVSRLTHQNLPEKFSEIDSRSFFLLDFDKESWRFYQTLSYTSSVEIHEVFPHPTSATFLLSLPSEDASLFEPVARFPTEPSIPFYSELRQRGIETY